MISIVIPTYNESKIIEDNISRLHQIIDDRDEIVVVDGKSEDNTRDIVRQNKKTNLVISERGRAIQMNAGAKTAKGEYVLFLHADVIISKNSLLLLKDQIKKHSINWGWFTIRLNSSRFVYRVIEHGANIRNRITGVPLGDHGIFVRRDWFLITGGFPEIPIMEEFKFINKLKSMSKGTEIKSPVYISVRRFENYGILRTILLMWSMRLLFRIGVKPVTLAKLYGNQR